MFQCHVIDWLIDWLSNWLIDWLIDWLIRFGKYLKIVILSWNSLQVRIDRSWIDYETPSRFQQCQGLRSDDARSEGVGHPTRRCGGSAGTFDTVRCGEHVAVVQWIHRLWRGRVPHLTSNLFIDWLIDRSIDRFIDSLIHWFIDWSIHWLIDCLIHWLIDGWIDWLIDWLIQITRISFIFDISTTEPHTPY